MRGAKSAPVRVCRIGVPTRPPVMRGINSRLPDDIHRDRMLVSTVFRRFHHPIADAVGQ